MKKRIGKYGVSAKKDRTLAGVTYMSKLEMQYRAHLNLLKKARLIEERVVSIEEQVPYKIEINGKLICHYLLDFKVEYGDGRIEHVDVKGMRTGVPYQLFKIKKKLVEALFPISIKEVYRNSF